MTPREHTILPVLFVIMCAAVFYNFGYRPSMERIEDSKVVLGCLAKDYERLLQWEKEVPVTEARLAEVQAELDGWVAEARAVGDRPLAPLFWELHGPDDRVEFNLIRLTGTQATIAFRAPDYESARTFLRRMEEKVAFEVLKARFSSPRRIRWMDRLPSRCPSARPHRGQTGRQEAGSIRSSGKPRTTFCRSSMP